ncbi:MAG: YebC/PmpR family DNA-binding transcriptional regulator [Patescibacteria group bacterium]
MARHSKWHKVRQFKGAIDAKRAASFTKLSHEITVAVKEKGPDVATNVRLKVAIERAKKASMTKDTIERAIQRGAGGSGEGQLESPIYEAYAPGGTALVIECLTDNKNRSTNDVKHMVAKAGGTLASSGAVTYLFDRVGVVRIVPAIPPDRRDEAELSLIDAGTADIVHDEEGTDVRCVPSGLGQVADAAQKLGFTVDSAEFEWIPKITIETDEATGLAVSELIEQLEALDDVSRVSSNLA